MNTPTSLSEFFRRDELDHEDLAATVVLTEQEQPGHAERFLQRVAASDGPVDRLDYSIGSLRTAWVWFASSAKPEPTGHPTDPTGLALWMRGLAGRVAVVGLDYAWAGTELGGYFAQTLRANTRIRFALQSHNKWPVLVGPSGAETDHYPMSFVASFKPERLEFQDLLIRRALRLAGGFNGIPEPLFQVEKFADEVIVTFPDDVANLHFEIVLEVERRVLGLLGVGLVEGDKEHLAFRETRPLPHEQLWLRVTQVLADIVDPRFES